MYGVEWVESAVEELAKIWADADSTLRQAVTSATYQIDQFYEVTSLRRSWPQAASIRSPLR